MRRCELCKAKARMHCSSDQASLCWSCDAAVHSANFLVARHSRNLLCGVCQSPTSWSTSGGKVRPTVSVCEQCLDRERCDDSGEEEVEEAEAGEGEIVEDNQLVPWSPPPPADSSSSDDELVSDRDVVVSRKRFRIEADQSCTNPRSNIRPSPPYAAAHVTKTFPRSKTATLQKSKMMKSDQVCESGIWDSLRRLHQEDMDSGQKMVEFCSSTEPSI